MKHLLDFGRSIHDTLIINYFVANDDHSLLYLIQHPQDILDLAMPQLNFGVKFRVYLIATFVFLNVGIVLSFSFLSDYLHSQKCEDRDHYQQSYR
jgi:hypothetical protein